MPFGITDAVFCQTLKDNIFVKIKTKITEKKQINKNTFS